MIRYSLLLLTTSIVANASVLSDPNRLQNITIPSSAEVQEVVATETDKNSSGEEAANINNAKKKEQKNSSTKKTKKEETTNTDSNKEAKPQSNDDWVRGY